MGIQKKIGIFNVTNLWVPVSRTVVRLKIQGTERVEQLLSKPFHVET